MKKKNKEERKRYIEVGDKIQVRLQNINVFLNGKVKAQYKRSFVLETTCGELLINNYKVIWIKRLS